MKLTRQTAINTIARLLNEKIEPSTLTQIESLATIFHTLPVTPTVNELRGIVFGSHPSERIANIEEAIESADDHRDAFVKYVVSETENCYLEMIKSGPDNHDRSISMRSRIHDLAGEYKALGYRPLEIMIRVPLNPHSNANEDIADRIVSDRGLEPFVDVQHGHNKEGLFIDIFLPDDKDMTLEIIQMLKDDVNVLSGATIQHIAPLIPGYKSEADCIARIERRRELHAESHDNGHSMSF